MAALWSLLLFSACSSRNQDDADRLNDLSYSFHYRSLDSVRVYADSVLNTPSFNDDSKAEALNNLAFYNIGKMQYAVADSLLHSVPHLTDNHIELLIASIQMMRLCMQMSHNKEFYDYRQRALMHLSRIHEDIGVKDYSMSYAYDEILLTPHQSKRLRYAETEFRQVSSVYYYYVGHTAESQAMVAELDSLTALRNDTAQYVAYLYNVGSGGILTKGSTEEIAQQEFAYLLRCYLISLERNYSYWQANAMQALSEHLMSADLSAFDDNRSAIHYLNIDNVPDSLLAGNLAQRALDIFSRYGDVYQTAASWRTLAECYWQLGDYPGAVYSLQNAIGNDTLVYQSPSLMSSIHEQFSLAFSALDEKQQSDYHRNMYLDLYEKARQDRQLEARVELLDKSLTELNWIVSAIILVIIALTVLLVFLVVRRRKMKNDGKTMYNSSVERWKKEYTCQIEELREEQEETEEQCRVEEMQLSRQQESYVEHCAKIHLVNSLTPLIDRMLHEIRSLIREVETGDKMTSESQKRTKERKTYVQELISKINETNDFLTRWIQLKQGTLSLKIESFNVQSLFEIVSKNSSSYTRQGVTLNIEPTDANVKADRSLTLFMINTLCDNARKFTPSGGTITLMANDNDGMVEISVVDTGHGMSAEQVEHLFDIKPIVDNSISSAERSHGESMGHGFGLLNCKGIIEKYKKTNALFSRCSIDVDSVPGKGSRFSFRLPQAVVGVLVILFTLPTFAAELRAAETSHTPTSPYVAGPIPDSIYQCNVQGRYADAIAYAKEYLHQLNDSYRGITVSGTDTLMLFDPILATPPELRWYADSINVPYTTLLSVRNEVAVAALALHQWNLYTYNNNVYSQLYKEYYADNSLADYCQQMQQTEINRNVAVTLLIILLLSFIPTYYMLYYRHVITDVRTLILQLQQEIDDQRQQLRLLTDKLSRFTFERERLHVANNVLANSLSAIKHETMYYPSRIAQLVEHPDIRNLTDACEVAEYYRAVYGVLSRQTQHNCRLHLSPGILFSILFDNLSRLQGERINPDTRQSTDDVYATLNIGIRRYDDVRVRVCTQVVRELGERFSLRRCGITIADTRMIVVIPLYDHIHTDLQ